MKTVITLEERQPVKVERYEKTLKVGERYISFPTFFEALAEEMHVEYLFNYLMHNRHKDTESYFEEIEQETDIGIDFISVILANLKTDILAQCIKKEDLSKFAEYIFKDLDEIPDESRFIRLLDVWGKRYPKFQTKESVNVISGFIDKILTNADGFELRNFIGKFIKAAFKSENEQVLENCFIELTTKLDKMWMKDVLNKTKHTEHRVYGTAMIPQNCLMVSVNSDGFSYVFEVPKSKLRVKLFDIVYENVGHPRLVFVVKTDNDGNPREAYCAAIKNNATITEETELFVYPFSNVFSTGALCWNGLTEMKGQLHLIPSMFLSTSNNKHLNNNVDKLYEYYSGKAFPDKDLKPMNRTLRMFL